MKITVLALLTILIAISPAPATEKALPKPAFAQGYLVKSRKQVLATIFTDANSSINVVAENSTGTPEGNWTYSGKVVMKIISAGKPIACFAKPELTLVRLKP